MSSRVWSVAAAAALAAAGIGLVQPRVQAARVPARQADLDRYSDAQLTRMLIAEIDDIYEVGPPGEQHPLATLQEEILDALSDEGDDADEDDIDREDIDDELEEADTSVDEVLEDALATADQLALREGAPSRSLAAGGSTARLAAFHPEAQPRNRRGFTTKRVAVRETAKALVVAIRQSR